jgi:hypothetical protein
MEHQSMERQQKERKAAPKAEQMVPLGRETLREQTHRPIPMMVQAEPRCLGLRVQKQARTRQGHRQ